jgi:hypothetical protein
MIRVQITVQLHYKQCTCTVFSINHTILQFWYGSTVRDLKYSCCTKTGVNRTGASGIQRYDVMHGQVLYCAVGSLLAIGRYNYCVYSITYLCSTGVPVLLNYNF